MYRKFKLKNPFFYALIVFYFSIFGCSEKNPTEKVPGRTNSKIIRFVQLTDLHFGYDIHDKNTERAIDIINNLAYSIDFVVVTGDIFADNILDPAARKTASMLKKIKFPLHVLPGNHDINGVLNWAEVHNYFKNLFGKYNNYRDIGDWRFIFYNSEPLRTGDMDHAFDIEKLIDNKKNNIIFHHAPCVDDFYRGKIHSVWRHKNTSEMWKRSISKAGVKAVITGHLHRSELHYINHVPVHSAPSIAVYWGRQSAFRIYTIREGKIGFQTIYIQ
ncbi:metallophosphoesterase [Myxococcota bacterium]|nr:metallophosphoesterase [Myxococcota bacterium]MBU1380745.1 metallophosphoesterase [Myxococcota bacterium]MBU1498027.1 metallophosphoesterase [Myxococcota bacterium]